jgi:hypothetical protein
MIDQDQLKPMKTNGKPSGAIYECAPTTYEGYDDIVPKHRQGIQRQGNAN